MTYKEKVLSVIPLASSPKLLGGIPGCPGHYEFASDGPVCGSQDCIGCGGDNCEKCWNTEMPEEKKTESKKAETPMDLIVKALESNDKSVHLRVEPGGITSVDIVPMAAFKEDDIPEEPASKPAESDGWQKIEYGRDEHGKRIIVKNMPPEYVPVNVYCSENNRVYSAYWSVFKESWMIAASAPNGIDKPVFVELRLPVTHWMLLPEPPKED